MGSEITGKTVFTLLLFIFVISLGGGLVWSANHYNTKYQDEKQRADKAEQGLTLANQTITDMQTRQRDVTALDAKYTKELADAKKQLEDLQLCVSTGKCGLHVNAKCPTNGTASTTGMDDASGPRLTDAAQRDYFTLRERIETATKQITGLQEYIRQQCVH